MTWAYREIVELPGLHFLTTRPLAEIAWHDSEALEMVSGRNKVIDEMSDDSPLVGMFPSTPFSPCTPDLKRSPIEDISALCQSVC